jgi:Tfp pilus assembly protein PilF
MRGDDPVDVREYYQDYRTGRYAAVLAAGDSMVMKIPVRKLLVRDYMRLYLGLSYLASGDGQNAVRELEGVVLRTKPKDILYETARWYLALAWLKRNDVDAGEAENKALDLAREISHSYSRYQEPARELIKALGS